ncbi:MAG: cation:proton antiporter [Spirochaetes bacterium]|nr:cation:proton antiporter [Spirochaetota bacterium]MBN2772279.1 cation:proton antiporter [Spirochaetota bacterium]
MIEIAEYMRENLTHNILFTIGFLLFTGYFLGKLAALIKLPEISSYIIAGVAVNSFTTGIISIEMNESLHIITEVAIGLLALSIGSEFSLKKMRRMGKHIILITVFQFIVTFSLVTGALLIFDMQLPFTIILAVTACATAPVVIVAEVHHLRAYGKFVDYLFGTVVLVDAFCVILFGMAFTLVTNYLDISSPGSFMILASFSEIALSILTGLISGIIIHTFTGKSNNEHEILIITLSIVFITTGISLVFHFSPLLLNITTGTTLANLSSRNHRVFKLIEPLTPPVYALFFIIAGIEIDPGVFFKLGILMLALVYFASRFFGKYAGVWIGCHIGRTETSIRDYLGLCMMSQAGIALGFVLLIQTSPMLARLTEGSPEKILFNNMMNIVLISIFLNELIGPVLSRFAIIKGNRMEE